MHRPRADKHTTDGSNLYVRMRDIQEQYPLYTPAMYRKKIMQVLATYKLNNDPYVLRLTDMYMDYKGWDIEEKFVSWMRGFADAENFCEKFRFKPCAPILSMIISRTKHFTEAKHEKKMAFIKRMTRELQDMGFFIPGNATPGRAFWLYPIMTNNSEQFCKFMNKQGFFCFQGSTQLKWVPMPESHVERLGDNVKDIREYF